MRVKSDFVKGLLGVYVRASYVLCGSVYTQHISCNDKDALRNNNYLICEFTLTKHVVHNNTFRGNKVQYWRHVQMMTNLIESFVRCANKYSPETCIYV